jgi:uncharacterized protein (DUF1684 family)
VLPELELLDWKRRIFDLYSRLRSQDDPQEGWRLWRAERDRMFRDHPQSPRAAAARRSFKALPYFDFDPAARVSAEIRPATPERYEIATSGGSTYSFTRSGVASFGLLGENHDLEIYWLDGYGGGLFVAFRDATAGRSTYGAGRYLLDTVKGSDLGMDGDRLVLDFNFAYNPSCAYDPKWVCPLAPPPNRLAFPIQAGEQAFPGA